MDSRFKRLPLQQNTTISIAIAFLARKVTLGGHDILCSTEGVPDEGLWDSTLMQGLRHPLLGSIWRPKGFSKARKSLYEALQGGPGPVRVTVTVTVRARRYCCKNIGGRFDAPENFWKCFEIPAVPKPIIPEFALRAFLSCFSGSKNGAFGKPVSPCQKRGGFDENSENDEFAF